MAHKGFIEASFDPGLIFGGVHLANWVPGGNVTVRDVATTHLAVQAASGNVSVYRVDASSVIALAGAKQNRKRREHNRKRREENRTEQSRAAKKPTAAACFSAAGFFAACLSQNLSMHSSSETVVFKHNTCRLCLLQHTQTIFR